ncbi:hypothetical protein DOE78_15405 [Bacillus sp. Y1]|nr:hypothetical protein [Bacillus sp. Y1]AYA76718.1 hypothetical protein DOE78_15405 [Bacillus sp. Y1]
MNPKEHKTGQKISRLSPVENCLHKIELLIVSLVTEYKHKKISESDYLIKLIALKEIQGELLQMVPKNMNKMEVKGLFINELM